MAKLSKYILEIRGEVVNLNDEIRITNTESGEYVMCSPHVIFAAFKAFTDELKKEGRAFDLPKFAAPVEDDFSMHRHWKEGEGDWDKPAIDHFKE